MNNNLIVRYYNPFSGIKENSMDLSSLGFNNTNIMTIKESIDTCLNEDEFYKDKIRTVQAVANKLWPNNNIKKINFKKWFENYSKMFIGNAPLPDATSDVVTGTDRIQEFENLTNITDTESHIHSIGSSIRVIQTERGYNENLTWEYFTFINTNTPHIQELKSSNIIRDITLEKLENNIVRTINTVFIKEIYESLPVLAFYHDLRKRSTLDDYNDNELVKDSLYQGCDLQPIHSDMPLHIVSKLKIKDPNNHNNYENYLLVYVSELSFQEFSSLPIYNSLNPRYKIFKRYSSGKWESGERVLESNIQPFFFYIPIKDVEIKCKTPNGQEIRYSWDNQTKIPLNHIIYQLAYRDYRTRFLGDYTDIQSKFYKPSLTFRTPFGYNKDTLVKTIAFLMKKYNIEPRLKNFPSILNRIDLLEEQHGNIRDMNLNLLYKTNNIGRLTNYGRDMQDFKCYRLYKPDLNAGFSSNSKTEFLVPEEVDIKIQKVYKFYYKKIYTWKINPDGDKQNIPDDIMDAYLLFLKEHPLLTNNMYNIIIKKISNESSITKEVLCNIINNTEFKYKTAEEIQTMVEKDDYNKKLFGVNIEYRTRLFHKPKTFNMRNKGDMFMPGIFPLNKKIIDYNYYKLNEITGCGTKWHTYINTRDWNDNKPWVNDWINRFPTNFGIPNIPPYIPNNINGEPDLNCNSYINNIERNMNINSGFTKGYIHLFNGYSAKKGEPSFISTHIDNYNFLYNNIDPQIITYQQFPQLKYKANMNHRHSRQVERSEFRYSPTRRYVAYGQNNNKTSQWLPKHIKKMDICATLSIPDTKNSTIYQRSIEEATVKTLKTDVQLDINRGKKDWEKFTGELAEEQDKYINIPDKLPDKRIFSVLDMDTILAGYGNYHKMCVKEYYVLLLFDILNYIKKGKNLAQKVERTIIDKKMKQIIPDNLRKITFPLQDKNIEEWQKICAVMTDWKLDDLKKIAIQKGINPDGRNKRTLCILLARLLEVEQNIIKLKYLEQIKKELQEKGTETIKREFAKKVIKLKNKIKAGKEIQKFWTTIGNPLERKKKNIRIPTIIKEQIDSYKRLKDFLNEIPEPICYNHGDDAFENLDINNNRTFDQLPGNDFFVLVSKEKSVCFHKEWIKEMGKPDQDGKFFYEWTANETSKYIWEHLSNKQRLGSRHYGTGQVFPNQLKCFCADDLIVTGTVGEELIPSKVKEILEAKEKLKLQISSQTDKTRKESLKNNLRQVAKLLNDLISREVKHEDKPVAQGVGGDINISKQLYKLPVDLHDRDTTRGSFITDKVYKKLVEIFRYNKEDNSFGTINEPNNIHYIILENARLGRVGKLYGLMVEGGIHGQTAETIYDLLINKEIEDTRELDTQIEEEEDKEFTEAEYNNLTSNVNKLKKEIEDIEARLNEIKPRRAIVASRLQQAQNEEEEEDVIEGLVEERTVLSRQFMNLTMEKNKISAQYFTSKAELDDYKKNLFGSEETHAAWVLVEESDEESDEETHEDYDYMNSQERREDSARLLESREQSWEQLGRDIFDISTRGDQAYDDIIDQLDETSRNEFLSRRRQITRVVMGVDRMENPTEAQLESAESQIQSIMSELGLTFIRRHENGNLNIDDFSGYIRLALISRLSDNEQSSDAYARGREMGREAVRMALLDDDNDDDDDEQAQEQSRDAANLLAEIDDDENNRRERERWEQFGRDIFELARTGEAGRTTVEEGLDEIGRQDFITTQRLIDQIQVNINDMEEDPTELDMERAESEIERLISVFGLMFMRRHENGNLNTDDFPNYEIRGMFEFIIPP